MTEISEVIKLLENDNNNQLENLKTCQDALEVLKKCIEKNVISSSKRMHDAIRLIEEYGFLKYIHSDLTKEKIEQMLYAMHMYNPFANKRIKQALSNVKMNGNKFEDVSSYITLLDTIYSIASISIDYEKLTRRMGKFIRNKHYDTLELLEELIMPCYKNLVSVLEKLSAKILGISSKYNDILQTLYELENSSIEQDFQKYQSLVNSYSKLVRNNLIFKSDKTDELNRKLKLKIDEYKKSLVKDASQPIKLGTREERIENHRKNSLLSELDILKSNLDGNSTSWIELLVNELQNLDETGVEEFLQNPNKYLPNPNEKNKDAIIKATAMELDYYDANEKIIEVLYSLTK